LRRTVASAIYDWSGSFSSVSRVDGVAGRSCSHAYPITDGRPGSSAAGAAGAGDGRLRPSFTTERYGIM
jgi:hypothetical protein